MMGSFYFHMIYLCEILINTVCLDLFPEVLLAGCIVFFLVLTSAH